MEVANKAKLIDYANYDWKAAAADAMILQTSNSKLREKALQHNVNYDQLMAMGIVKEQSEKGAAQIAGASNVSIPRDEEVRKLQQENKRLREKFKKKLKVSNDSNQCNRCGNPPHPRGQKCSAFGQQCLKCKYFHHLTHMCKTKLDSDGKPGRQLSDLGESDSEESCGCFIEIKKIDDQSITAKVNIGIEVNKSTPINLSTDTGVRKTLINKQAYEQIKSDCSLVRTSKRFRPYGTHYLLPIISRRL